MIYREVRQRCIHFHQSCFCEYKLGDSEDGYLQLQPAPRGDIKHATSTNQIIYGDTRTSIII